MGRRNRSFLGLVVVGCGAVALYFYRHRYRRAFLAASDRVRNFITKTLRKQACQGDALPKPIITGLAAPEARPLSSLDQLLSWSPDPAADPDAPFCQTYNAPLMCDVWAEEAAEAAAEATHGGFVDPPAAGSGAPSATSAGGRGGEGLPCPRPRPRPRPRLLVCHDMMGGYLEDRWVQGATDPGFFRFWQWDQIDAFIYFSHHLVTLPPPGWIAAAHRNGVRVLGTFITEWAEGRSCCTHLLASPAAARAAADRLAALAGHHGFEGWLVNIENGLPRALVPHLMTFVGHLRARMAAVVGPQALVVWYDAITTEGRLAWQDGLTRLNAPFFDAADALFVNYRWREGAPAEVAAAAGSRAADVFMGVDVFGRGSFGGGKDNCPVALHAARSAGVSAALFAPGWVFEEFPRDTFEQRQQLFWERIRAVWPSRPAALQRLPLTTSFNLGAGRGVWVEGRRVSCAPWYQPGAQDPVAAMTPTTTTTATTATTATATTATTTTATIATELAAASPLAVRPTCQLAFCGGSCLTLRLAPPEEAEAGAEGLAAPPPPTAAGGPWSHDLYSAHLAVPPAGLDLSYTVACAGPSRVAVLLRTAAPPRPQPSAAVAMAAAGGPWVGLAVGPWGAGDRAVVEALRRSGYCCVVCPATPTGATTCPLQEPGVTAAAAPASASVPAGLPWITCSAHLPYSIFTAGPTGGGAVITAVGVVCFRTAAAAAAGGPAGAAASSTAALSSGGGVAPSGGGGRLSARGSSTGFTAAAAAAAAAADGGDGAPFQAFLGRLALRAHRPQGRLTFPQGPAALTEPPAAAVAAVAASESSLAAAAAAAAASAGPLGLPLAAAAAPPPPAPPLSGASCFRVRWGRPGGSRPRSLRASYTSLAGAGVGVKEASVAAAAAATAADMGTRGSGELVDSGEGVEVEDDDDEWERSSVGGGGTAGGSPVKVKAPGAAAAAVDDDDGEGDVTLGGGGGGGGDAESPRLLTCELSWEPQFEVYGTPRHRSYHIWAHFSAAAVPAAGLAASPSRAAAAAAAVTSPGVARGGGGGGGGADDRESAWEVLHPDWSGAVWVGEAFVARYRVVQLEVPGWAEAVTLLAQPVDWEAVEPAQQPQQLATLAVPQQPQQPARP